MSYLERLMIRGIRSFGPDEQAVIEFGKPLTLIAGQNGAGKTTVIECLRYVTTGELPPNGKSGAFLHDPKLTKKSTVVGCIKVKCKDTYGNEITCLRVIQSSQKQKKIEQKQLDGSIERIDAVTGEKTKVTTRCVEISDEMVNCMGVSKAMLSNVIFCHQEESNWPLSEGKFLKLKFDDIFAASRYSKALESIRKFRIEQREQINLCNVELNHLKQCKSKADELKTRLKDTQRKVDAFNDDTTRVVNELKPIESRISELDRMHEEVQRMERQLAELRSSKKELEKQQQTLLEKIEEPLSGTLEELQTLYDTHHLQLDKDSRNLKKSQDCMTRVSIEENRLKASFNEQSKEYGRLEVECKQFEDSIKRRNSRITSLAEELGITDYHGDITNAALRQFLSEVVELINKKEEEGTKRRSKYAEAESSINDQITQLRDNLSRSQQKKEMKKKQLEDNMKQVQSITRQLQRVGGASSMFEQIERDLKKAESDLEQFNESVDVTTLENQLDIFSSEKRQIADNLSKLQQELNIINQQSSARGVLENLQKQKQSKEKEYHKTFEDIETIMLSVVGSMPTEDEIINTIDKFERTKKASLKKAQFQCTNLNKEIASLNAQLEDRTKQLKRKRDALEVLESEVSSVCGNTSYTDKKSEIEQERNKLEEDLTTVKGSQAYFKKCLSNARTSKKCPLCARGYDTQGGIDGLVTSIERRLKDKVPELVQTYEKQLKDTKNTYQQLILVKPKMDQIQELMDTEIPCLEKEVSSLTSKMETRKKDIDTVEKELSESQSVLDQISKLRPQATSLSNLQEDLKKLDKSISAELSKLGGGAKSQRGYAVVHRELQKAQMNDEEIGRRMDNIRKEMTAAERSTRELNESVLSYRQQKLELQEQVQKSQSLVTKKEDILAMNEGLKRDIEATTRQLKPLEEKLKEQKNELEKARREKETYVDGRRTEMSSLHNKKDNIVSSNKEVDRYEARGSKPALQECSSKMNDLTKQIDNNNGEKKSLEEEIDQLRKRLANAQVREREFLDNIELVHNQNNITKKDSDIAEISNQMKQKGLDKYNREYQRCKGDVDKLRTEKAKQEGRCQGKRDELRQLQRDLQTDMYKDVDKKFKDTSVLLQTTQISCSDLEKYYKALDRAIMSYHSNKMEQINKIIEHLWSKIYKGGDIDTIKVLSESDTEAADGTTSLSSRRTYHYRVVMVKGETEIDMRGRCSAGQKVLASIIIRLALADAFCFNCGILVLDEPTTNLDADNIRGLSNALSDVITERSQQKNFQLVLITHDMKFVEGIARSCDISEYTLVKKDKSVSSVEVVPIAHLPIYN